MLQVKDLTYLKGRAYVVEKPEDMPRELASEFTHIDMNPSFLWVAGRYVQGEKANKNGHYWAKEDLTKGEHTIKHVPLNIDHDIEHPVGAFVETKLIERDTAETKLPEIQALACVWAANFPAVASRIRAAHADKKLWFSMECVAERKQCMTCEQEFAYAAKAHEVCEHLATSAKASRRLINPVFLGGALIMPPSNPAWPDADITELASMGEQIEFSITEWEQMMDQVLASKDAI